MSKGNTWQKQKMAKHRANNQRAAHGGYARFAPVPAKAHGDDRRDGGRKALHYPAAPEPLGPHNAKEGTHIVTCKVSTARGLSKDIGRVGKEGRTLKTATRAQREHYSLRNLRGIIGSCFSTGTGEWKLYTPA